MCGEGGAEGGGDGDGGGVCVGGVCAVGGRQKIVKSSPLCTPQILPTAIK